MRKYTYAHKTSGYKDTKKKWNMQIDKEIYAKYFYFASKMIDFEQKRESNAPPFMKKLGFERMGLAVFVLEGVEFP